MLLDVVGAPADLVRGIGAGQAGLEHKVPRGLGHRFKNPRLHGLRGRRRLMASASHSRDSAVVIRPAAANASSCARAVARDSGFE